VHALMRYMQSDYPQDKLTISSDGGGCLPCFDHHGHMTKMDFANSSAMTDVFYQLLDHDIELSRFLPFFTSNVAELLNFVHKGQLKIGSDADLIVLNTENRIQHVMAQGHWHIFAQNIIKKGSFEN
jgi:beta-aspartyl-dipeptidase (metallo-type)